MLKIASWNPGPWACGRAQFSHTPKRCRGRPFASIFQIPGRGGREGSQACSWECYTHRSGPKPAPGMLVPCNQRRTWARLDLAAGDLPGAKYRRNPRVCDSPAISMAAVSIPGPRRLQSPRAITPTPPTFSRSGGCEGPRHGRQRKGVLCKARSPSPCTLRPSPLSHFGKAFCLQAEETFISSSDWGGVRSEETSPGGSIPTFCGGSDGTDQRRVPPQCSHTTGVCCSSDPGASLSRGDRRCSWFGAE